MGESRAEADEPAMYIYRYVEIVIRKGGYLIESLTCWHLFGSLGLPYQLAACYLARNEIQNYQQR